jgi:hypothetical protein
MKNVYDATRLAACACVLVLLGGCAFGQKITYSDTVADVEASGNKSIALATHDQRPYVVSGNKEPRFAGIARGGYGNPFDVSTVSGAPLADEFSSSISKSLDARGFRTSVVTVSATQSRRAALDALRKGLAQRSVLVTLKEWKSDKFFNTSVSYDSTVTVYDENGQELASRTFKGDDNIGKGPVLTEFKNKIEEWFSDPKIVAALK